MKVNKSGSIENEQVAGSKYKASYFDIIKMFWPIQNFPGRACQVSGPCHSAAATHSNDRSEQHMYMHVYPTMRADLDSATTATHSDDRCQQHNMYTPAHPHGAGGS